MHMKNRIMIALAMFAPFAFAVPVAAQITANLPVTCNAAGTICVQATPVTNPDGTTVGGGGGTYNGPVAAQLPATLGAKAGAASLSVVPNTDTPFPITCAACATQTTVAALLTSMQATGLTAQNVQGSAATTSTTAINPFLGAGRYNSTQPTYTTGQLGEVQITATGNVRVLASVIASAATDGTSNAIGFLARTDATGSGLVTAMGGFAFNATTWDRIRTIPGSDGTGLGVTATAVAPQSSANGAITPVVGSLVSNLAAKTTTGNLYAVTITTGATAGYVYVFNSTGTVADGAVTAGTASGNYQLCTAVAATTSVTISFDIPERYSVGIRPYFSTTACGILTASTTAVFFKARVQ